MFPVRPLAGHQAQAKRVRRLRLRDNVGETLAPLLRLFASYNLRGFKSATRLAGGHRAAFP